MGVGVFIFGVFVLIWWGLPILSLRWRRKNIDMVDSFILAIAVIAIIGGLTLWLG